MHSPRRSFCQRLAATLLAVILPSLAFAAVPDGSKPNLLVNGDFSKGIEGWEFNSNRKQGQATPDDTEKHEGHPSVRIDNLGADDSHLSQKVTVKPATRYRLTGWARTRGVAGDDPKNTAGASVGVRGSFLMSKPPVNKTQGWKHLSVEIVTVAETEISVGPRLGSFGAVVKGSAWFAELEFKEIGPAAKR